MGEKESFLAPKEIKDKYHVSNTTLQRWEKQGKIVCRKTPGGIRRYRAEDISKIFGEPAEDALIQAKNRQDICYARVSSDHQRGDLERQAEYLKGKYPTALFIKDVGSGLNWNRPGFKRLLELVHQRKVSTLVVAHRDRLCRFAFELVEWFLEKAGVKLVVLSQGEGGHLPQDPQHELAEDLLAVTNHFVAKNNGLRAAANKKRRNEDKEQQNHQQREDQEGNSSNKRPKQGGAKDAGQEAQAQGQAKGKERAVEGPKRQ